MKRAARLRRNTDRDEITRNRADNRPIGANMKLSFVLSFVLLCTLASAEVKTLQCTEENNNNFSLSIRLDEANSRASAGRDYDTKEPNPWQTATFTDDEIIWKWDCPTCDRFGDRYKINRINGRLDLAQGGYSTYKVRHFSCEAAQQKF